MNVQRTVGFAQGILAIALVVAVPLIDMPATKRLKQFSSSRERLALYRRWVVLAWALVAIALTLTSFKTVFWVTPQANEASWLFHYPMAHGAVALCVTAFFLLALWPGIKCVVDTSVRPRYRKAMRSLIFMMPVTQSERLWWALLSVTAGICEELLFRGFLLQYARGQLEGGPALGLTLAWLLTSLGFGLCHIYQGLSGFVRTTIAGLMLGMLAILTGNLLLPIVVHCLLDLQVLLMYQPMKDSPEETPTLISGFCPQNQ
jgi:uncharacterized protein